MSEIVRRLDGIALAIELAAARTPVLGVAQIRERLSRRFELLRIGRRDALARQATMRGAIDWSWNLLEPAERQALAQCSVFRGGFTLDAAEAVLSLPPDSPDVLDVIQSLRSKSLLRTAPTGDLTGERRLALYESVREYASERLVESGAEATWWRATRTSSWATPTCSPACCTAAAVSRPCGGSRPSARTCWPWWTTPWPSAPTRPSPWPGRWEG